MKIRILKSISAAVVLTFLTTSINPVSYANPIAMPEVSPVTAGTLSIPAELGQVTDTVAGESSAPAFIHIQSAHGNYAAEKNIEKLLGYIEKNSSVKLMLLEGASDRLQPELFRLFPENHDFNAKVTDKLMQEGYLTGPERFLIENADYSRLSLVAGKKLATSHQSPATMQAYGIEDLAAYKKDRDAFISVVKSDKTAQAFLLKLRAAIDKRFSSKLNKDLLNLVRQEEALASGTVSFESWIKTLGEGSKKHLKTDLADAFYQDQYPSLIRYFRLQAIGSKIDRDKANAEVTDFIKELVKRKISKDVVELFKTELDAQVASRLSPVAGPDSKTRATSDQSLATNSYSPLRHAFDLAFDKLPKDFPMKAWPNWTLYAQHLILMQEIEGKGLHEETVRLKDKIETALAKTAEEKEYLVQARQLYLLRRLFSLELTRAEYEEFLTLSQRLQVEKSQRGDMVTLRPGDLPVFHAALSFYSTAVIREQMMFKNALSQMSSSKQQRAVIVTGGFHAEGLKKLAASKNCSYIQITPRIAEVSKRDHEVYLKQMLGERDFATSQAVPLLGVVPVPQRAFVTGATQTKVWRSEIRALVETEINSEEVIARAGLKQSFAASAFGVPAPALAPAKIRSEARLTPAEEKQFGQTTDHRLPATAKASSLKTLVFSLLSAVLVAAALGVMVVSVKAGDVALTPTNQAVVRGESQALSKKPLSKEDEEKFQKAVRDLKSETPSDRRFAAVMLGVLKDPRAIDSLVKALGEENNFIRSLIVEAIGKINDPRVTEPLIKALSDKDDEVRRFAAIALGEIQDPRAVKPLMEAFLNDREPRNPISGVSDSRRDCNYSGGYDPLIGIG